MPNSMRLMILVAAATLLGACADMEEDNSVVATDAGTLCMLAQEPLIPGLSGDDPAFTDFEAGEPLVVTVALDACLSSSCDINRSAECQVALRGHNLIVTSELAYEMSGQIACTKDCGRLVATCQSVPLQAGQYTVVFGDAKYDLAVPSTLPAACH